MTTQVEFTKPLFKCRGKVVNFIGLQGRRKSGVKAKKVILSNMLIHCVKKTNIYKLLFLIGDLKLFNCICGCDSNNLAQVGFLHRLALVVRLYLYPVYI